MGPRKGGGGRSGFMKAARAKQDDAEEEQQQPEAAKAPEPAPAPAPSKAAAFLKDPEPAAASDSDDSDGDDEGGPETRGKMLQRHKRVRRRRRCLLHGSEPPQLANASTSRLPAPARQPAGAEGAEGQGEEAGQEGQGRGGAAGGGDGRPVSGCCSVLERGIVLLSAAGCLVRQQDLPAVALRGVVDVCTTAAGSCGTTPPLPRIHSQIHCPAAAGMPRSWPRLKAPRSARLPRPSL